MGAAAGTFGADGAAVALGSAFFSSRLASGAGSAGGRSAVSVGAATVFLAVGVGLAASFSGGYAAAWISGLAVLLSLGASPPVSLCREAIESLVGESAVVPAFGKFALLP